MSEPLSNIRPIEHNAEPSVENSADAANTVAELRHQVGELQRTLSAELERLGVQAHRGLDQGAEQLRSQIRSSPGIALSVAVVAGALIALAVTQPARPRTVVDRARDTYRRAVTDFDADQLLARLERTAGSARDQASGLVPTVENWARSLSQMEPAAMQPMIDKGTAWAQAIWDKVAARTAQFK